MRTWIVTCPTISIDVAQRLRSMLLFQARLGWLPKPQVEHLVNGGLIGWSFCFVLLQDSAGIAVGGAEAEVGYVDRRSYGSFGRRIAGF